jgi:branched-chain amino acid transport system permease protein
MSKRTFAEPTKPIALGLGVIILIGLPLLITSNYYLHLLIVAGMNAVLAMTFVLMLRTGLVSMSIAAFWGVGAYTATLLTMKWGASFWLALPLAAIVAAILALAIGALLVRNAAFSFLILTAVLALLTVFVFGNLKWLGGFIGIDRIPPPDPILLPFLPPIPFDSKPAFYYLMLFLLGLAVIFYRALYNSWAGRAWMAIGLNPRLAESFGVNVFRYRLLSFVIAAGTAGMMGGFYAHYIGAINPYAFNIFKTINVHIFAIMGGVQFPLLGPLLGSFVMTLVPELLRVAKEIEPIILGLWYILLMLFLPNGLLSLLQRAGKRSD